MGTRKISTEDEEAIGRVLVRWPFGKRLTWESLREALAADSAAPSTVWSRQSLSASESVYKAYRTAKRRLADGKPVAAKSVSESELFDKVAQLESDLSELQKKYDLLLLRHNKLSYNASLLEGGIRLLDEPLPDNTKSQQG